MTAGPVISTGAARSAATWPRAMVEPATTGLHVDLLVEQAEPDARDHRRAGTGATGQGLASAALVDAQLDLGAIDDLQEAGIDPLGEGRMALDQRAPLGHRRGLGIVDQQHRMRVAHRDHRDRRGHDSGGQVQRQPARSASHC